MIPRWRLGWLTQRTRGSPEGVRFVRQRGRPSRRTSTDLACGAAAFRMSLLLARDPLTSGQAPPGRAGSAGRRSSGSSRARKRFGAVSRGKPLRCCPGEGVRRNGLFCHATKASITSAAPTTLTRPTHDLEAGAAGCLRSASTVPSDEPESKGFVRFSGENSLTFVFSRPAVSSRRWSPWSSPPVRPGGPARCAVRTRSCPRHPCPWSPGRTACSSWAASRSGHRYR